MSDLHAPYNFIGFLRKVLLRYEKVEELPPHDRVVPSLKTGEIHLTLTARTPVFVSTGPGDGSGFFCGANHRQQIPGSSIRGVIRTNLQILGAGYLRPGEDVTASSEIIKGLPDISKKLSLEPFVLDYPRAMLGFKTPKCAYASRVAFSDFPVTEKGKEGMELRVLKGPHTESYDFYLKDGKSYQAEEYRLRGYKLYWMKKVSDGSDRPGAGPGSREDSGMDARQNYGMDGRQKSGMNAGQKGSRIMRPLPGGTVFKGVIRYKNLAEDELGLLLWAVGLEPGCFQSVGMGKPYGFGCMEPVITKLLEYDPDKMYAPEHFLEEPYEVFTGAELGSRIRQYVDCYETRALAGVTDSDSTWKDRKDIKFRDFQHMRDFFFMHQFQEKMPVDEMSYMDSSEKKICTGPLKTVKEYRTEQK